ncbi:MAG TPA: aspartate aminotransferase family protein [Spirochaetota bacterium]|jgi:acetylornithine/N-succinyldiaminopimelate aminotransferase|nr:aspartate aminotransferase family protein [Spirochaetota bacterium]HPO45489.1 aspartate aminotransferase family protein [Spirochaetota bacterium]
MENDHKYLFQNYGDRLPVCFVGGEGSSLYDQDGRRYIDFFAGIAVSTLGHAHPGFVKRLQAQLERPIHSSNWFYNGEQAAAGRLIGELSFPGKTLFVNSGTEANEAALKLARAHGQSISPERYEIISFEGSFHGRTFGGMSATAQEKIRKGFGPIVPGFAYLPFNDIRAVAQKIEQSDRVCAVITELVQGEGGIRIADREFIRSLSALCSERGVLLIIDEVQTGVGRTGRAFAYQHFGIKPDIITLAKGLGGGVPVGAMHARSGLSPLFGKGVHGTTFGGNHLACAAVEFILKELKKPALSKNVSSVSAFIFDRLRSMKAKSPSLIREVRGLGLHIGIELSKPGMDIVKKALAAGLIINCTAERVIRIMPPLNISIRTAREGMKILESILESEASS